MILSHWFAAVGVLGGEGYGWEGITNIFVVGEGKWFDREDIE
jgi:hypothetical protein